MSKQKHFRKENCTTDLNVKSENGLTENKPVVVLMVTQGGHKPGRPGKLREFESVRISGKTQGNLNFCRKNLENSGKMKNM